MTSDEDGTVIGRNTRITVALAAGLFALSIGAITSYYNFQAAVRAEIRDFQDVVRKEIRDTSTDVVVEVTKMGVQLDELSQKSEALSRALVGSEARAEARFNSLEGRSEARYNALEERLRALENKQD